MHEWIRHFLQVDSINSAMRHGGVFGTVPVLRVAQLVANSHLSWLQCRFLTDPTLSNGLHSSLGAIT